MDTRKSSFLQAVIGVDGAQALNKATAASPDLEWALLPRVIMAWLEVASHASSFDSKLPGTDVGFSFRKSEDGYAGTVSLGTNLYKFTDASLYHVAGSIAVALGAATEHTPELRSPALAKLGKSVDLLVRSRTLRKIAELEKKSWNATARRRYHFAPGADKPQTFGEIAPSSDPVFNKTPIPLERDQVDARRERYMRSVGLVPDTESYSGAFPNAKGTNRVPYNGSFDAAHETAHALMTPDDQNLGEYQQWLTDRAARPSDPNNSDLDPDEAEQQYHDEANNFIEGAHHENVANAAETYIDRRAGVDPHMYQSRFRAGPTGLDPEDEASALDPKSGGVRSNPAHNKAPLGSLRGAARYSWDPKTPFFNQDIRDEAKEHVKGFDDGKRFDATGKTVPPKGVDAKINARQKANPTLKAEPKAHGGAKGNPPGTTAAPRPPMGPIGPTSVQPRVPSQVGSKVGTMMKPTKPASGSATPSATVKLPGVKPPKKPTLKVTKAEAAASCDACGGSRFRADKFVACMCFRALAKSVTVSPAGDGYVLEFGTGWDDDAILALALDLKGAK